MSVLEEYIRSEQELGRIASVVDSTLAAYLMMSASFFRAFVEHFVGKSVQPAWSKFAEQLVATITPKQGRTGRNEKVTFGKVKR